MSDDRPGRRRRLIIPMVIAVTLIVDGGRAALSQQSGPDARVADGGAIVDAATADAEPDAFVNHMPPEGGGGCACPGIS